MAEYQLYCFAESGNAYKAALMLQLCRTDWTPRFVDFFNGETRTPEYRANVNEMGEVPVLEHRGRLLAQSGVILDYLAAATGRYGAKDDEERREILRWLLWDNHKLTSYIATLRFLVHFQKTGETPVTEFLRGRVKTSLAILEKHLADFALARAHPLGAGLGVSLRADARASTPERLKNGDVPRFSAWRES